MAAVFPLVPRRRVIGLAFGGVRSARRGVGSDVASTREYRPGDDVAWMDWAASARLSAARGTDEFIVRERFADEAPRVVVLTDRRPSMAIESSPLRRVDKPQAILTALELIGASAIAARSLTGYLDYAEGEPYWRAPRTESRAEPGTFERSFHAPADTVSQGLDFLGEHRRDLPTQAFVFVLSDFIVPPDLRVWTRALEHRWELVPVMIQDPVWERSFPAVGGIAVPIAYADGRPVGLVRLSRRQAERRRNENESRYARLMAELESLALQPIALATSEPAAIDRAFLEWAEQRRRGRWTR